MNPHNVLTLNFDLPEKSYSEQQQIDFYTQLLSRMRALPGVVSAAAVTPLPLSGNNSIITFAIEGRPVPKAEEPSADIKVVLRTISIHSTFPSRAVETLLTTIMTNLRAWS
jgi:hypothetical protein